MDPLLDLWLALPSTQREVLGGGTGFALLAAALVELCTEPEQVEKEESSK